jgi:hypothetical protein
MDAHGRDLTPGGMIVRPTTVCLESMLCPVTSQRTSILCQPRSSLSVESELHVIRYDFEVTVFYIAHLRFP